MLELSEPLGVCMPSTTADIVCVAGITGEVVIASAGGVLAKRRFPGCHDPSCISWHPQGGLVLIAYRTGILCVDVTLSRFHLNSQHDAPVRHVAVTVPPLISLHRYGLRTPLKFLSWIPSRTSGDGQFRVLRAAAIASIAPHCGPWLLLLLRHPARLVYIASTPSCVHDAHGHCAILTVVWMPTVCLRLVAHTDPATLALQMRIIRCVIQRRPGDRPVLCRRYGQTRHELVCGRQR